MNPRIDLKRLINIKELGIVLYFGCVELAHHFKNGCFYGRTVSLFDSPFMGVQTLFNMCM